ncbi:hypothetical protein DFJ58DRAFT_800982 [Suillus subalutaceus]|uniref:uncharacterized protein n=1 Tax=Suillus subalutaceus TaxID=48586 RepID=UPI001B88178A|nr:uncharacterized protein DFJ58DRAFT_800982 [Suillus subalutaceus]KAG1845522.1 hypothetical protein DFJ58DRAFT_800982 [Suillus subalutaceus]
MDELVHHCLRELSFDGDLGCNVSRLRDFIVGFYSHDATHPQVVDDAFCAFVWSIVVQQPTVRVGTVPVGVSSEVYIAPQTSAKRKAAAKGEVLVEEAPPSLTLVENARDRSLEDLKAEYGEDLRIAVDPETSFAAITGSHIRSSKLSPMVYSALQLITRGREEGITTVELGRKTKYDQKTCFYVIKQLLELDLIIKARRGGVGNHSCIHKYFVERSAFWQQIQQEETKDDESIVIGESHPQDATPVEDGTPSAAPSELDFEPVDSRHLSSLSLIKNRIVKLLKASQNNMHASNNLIITIGFANPTKTDRRFFQTRLRELIAQGVIERVLVPSSKVKDRLVKCIRLVAPDNQLPEGGVILAPQEGEDDKEIMFDDTSAGHTEVRANRTIQKQVSDVLEEAGSSGRTLHEICSALGNFDKRTIELLLTRAAKSRPPAHLSDLGTADFMESFGRERRHRYYTLAAYTTVMASEKLGDTTTSYVDIDVSKAGDFAGFHEAMFYDDDETLHYYEDMFKDKEDAKVKTGAKKRKRPETEDPGDDEAVEDTPEPEGDGTSTVRKVPKSRGRPPKQKPDAEQTVCHAEVPRRESMKDVNVIVLPAQVPSAPPSETSGHPPESPGPPTSSPKEGSHLFQGSSDLSSSAPHEDPSDEQHRIRQAVADVHPEEPKSWSFDRKPEPTIRENDAFSSRKRLPGEGSNNRIDESEVVRIPQQVVDGARADGLFDMDNRPSAQESMIIDPVLLGTSPADVMPTVIGEKRKGSPPLATPSQPKRTRTSTPVDKLKTNLNISHLRRENEFFRVIQDLGGIANLHTKHFFDAHMALLNDMAQRGEPASAPSGTRIDKRTADATIKNMESRGRIKVLKTTVFSVTGSTRPACLVYLPDILQEKINAFLHHLSHTAPAPNILPVKTFQEPVDFGASSKKSGKDDDEHQELFAYDSETICDVLLTERTTVAQLYGFRVGKAARLRDFHVFTLGFARTKLFAPYCVPRAFHDRHFLVPARRSHCHLLLIHCPHSLCGGQRNTGQRPAEPYFSKAAGGKVACTQSSLFDGWRVSAPSAAPQYWRFNETAPLHLWALSNSSPPYWRHVSAKSRCDGVAFWDELHKVSRDVAYARSTVSNTPLLRFLRRRVSWDLEYRLTWHQKHSATAHSPLDEEDSDLQLQQICHVLSAPRAPVVAYLKDAAERVLRRKRDEAEHCTMQNIEAKTMLQKKAKEAKLQRESDWEALLQRVHPGPLKGTIGIRILAVRNRFVQSSSIRDTDRWQSEIENAVREARLASNKVIARPKALAVPRIAFTSYQSENKTSRQRRSRFHWTREYDELARDASAIIRARCRGGVKIDLSAFDQVFPAVPRNSVRLRLSHLRENTGEEVYMRRLEDRWHELWVQHRGTEHLPDEDPQSPSNFDIVNHIEFLRKHVDKNALQHTTRTKLPASVDDIIHRFDVLCNTTISPAWEFVWQATVEEGREKQFLRQSFTHGADEVPYVTNISDDVVQVAEAALKHYDADLAAELLHSAGDQSVSLATSNLLRRGVLSRVVRDPKKMKPGRTLKISDVNLNAIGGLIHGDLFQDAVALDEVFAEQVGILEWPLLASDGDTAALLQLVSEEQGQFIIDTAQLRNARTRLDWNSKKSRSIDDDIETSIQVRLNAVDNGDDNEGNGGAMFAFIRHATYFDRANASSESGSSKSHYLAFGAGDVVMDLLQRMSQTSPPLILWVGYSAPVIVSCLHARSWTVEIIREPKALALPRRWLDIRGETIQETWDAALHAVTELRWRLRAVCDRQELVDIVCFLYREEAVYARVSTECPTGTAWPATLDDGEEQQNKYWYQV